MAPLVVRARSTGNGDNNRTRSGSLARTVGSPPVSRMLRIPKRSTTRLATRDISSKESRSSRGSHSRPSAGMQYRQRKLHRSVTEMRRSRWTRPNPSINSPPTGTSVEGGRSDRLTAVVAPRRCRRRPDRHRRAARPAHRRRPWPTVGGNPAHPRKTPDTGPVGGSPRHEQNGPDRRAV